MPGNEPAEVVPLQRQGVDLVDGGAEVGLGRKVAGKAIDAGLYVELNLRK